MATDLFVPATAFPEVNYDEWRQRVLSEIESDTLAPLSSTTVDGIDIGPLHGAARRRSKGRRDAPFPLPSGGWQAWQALREPGGERLALALADELERGLDGLWLLLDAPSRSGLDADWEAAAPALGERGLSLTVAADARGVLGELSSRDAAIGVDTGHRPLALGSVLVAGYGEEIGEAAGILGADPVGNLVTTGELETGLETALDEMTEVAVWCGRQAPNLRGVLVSVTPYADAGAGEVQELAAALATAALYLRRLEDAGVAPEDAGSQLAFRFAVGRDVYLQAAKLRAARLLWSGLLASAGVEDDGERTYVHAVTAWRTKTAIDPWTNLIRNTLETLAAVLGGADSVEVTPHDAAVTDGASRVEARRLALATQLVLREEARLGVVADALRGSWYVEHLTEELAARAWETFRRLEVDGGIVASLRDGGLQRRVSKVAQERRRRLESREDEIVGVGLFPPAEWAEEGDRGTGGGGRDLETWRVRRREAVQQHRATQGAAVMESLERLTDDAGRPVGRRFDHAVAAARTGATLGQITAATDGDGSEPCRIEPLPAWRDAEVVTVGDADGAAADRARGARGARG